MTNKETKKRLYPKEFNQELKESIKKRDGYKCVLCKISLDELKRKHLEESKEPQKYPAPEWSKKILEIQLEAKAESNLHIHHIDYNKDNCEEENLITLCSSCHGRTNPYHARGKFIKLFKIIKNDK